MSAPDSFDTARLRCTRISAADYDRMCRLESDERAQAALFGARSPQETAERLERALAQWRDDGFGTWIAATHDGDFAGTGLLFRSLVEGETGIELGYAFLPDFWGRGFAVEMSRALLEIAFVALDLPYVLAVTARDHVRSRRVMEKLGMTFRRELQHRGVDCVVYAIERSAWQPAPVSPCISERPF